MVAAAVLNPTYFKKSLREVALSLQDFVDLQEGYLQAAALQIPFFELLYKFVLIV